jgi:hypothetical protein
MSIDLLVVALALLGLVLLDLAALRFGADSRTAGLNPADRRANEL